jgi:hypothetical protein
MPKRSSKKRAKNLPKTHAKERPAEGVTEEKKNPAAVALGRLGGLKGGRARAEKLSEERRQEIAKRAAQIRWSIRPS